MPGVLDTFVRLWETVLAEQGVEGRLRVLEPACGSANDYRFLAASGLARFLDYTGFDLCEQNVANARALFPGARFDVGQRLRYPRAGPGLRLLFLHDLFEHLLRRAWRGRWPRSVGSRGRGLCLGFFQMDETDEHLSGRWTSTISTR